MVEYSKLTVHLLVALNLLIFLEAKTTEIRTSEVNRKRLKRQWYGFSIGPFSWFQGGRYGRNYGFRPFLGQGPFAARRFWRRRFNRFGSGW